MAQLKGNSELARNCRKVVNQMKNNYKFPLFPYSRDYSQTLTFKLTLDIGYKTNDKLFSGDFRYVEDLLSHFKKLDNLTHGIPKLAILVGFQLGGHDRQYPSFTPINDTFKSRENPNMNPREALVYAMEQASLLYNTECTVHANIVDGYDDSSIWQEYIDNNAVCKDINGDYKKQWYDEANKRQGYAINVMQAWKKGLIKKQIDDLMLLLPPIVHSKAIYFDANCVFCTCEKSNTTKEDQICATKLIAEYVKAAYDCDLLGEYGLDVQYGFAAHGLTWDAGSAGKTVDPMKLAPYIMAGGTANCGGCDQMEIFGYSIQLGHETNECDDNEIKRQFFTHTIPYFYLNSKLRESYDEQNKCAQFSGNTKSVMQDGINIITTDDTVIKQGEVIFCPAIWCYEKEILAYSSKDVMKTFLLPQAWSKINSVDIYEISSDVPKKLLGDVKLLNGSLALSIKANQALSIIEHGFACGKKYEIKAAGYASFVEFQDNYNTGTMLPASAGAMLFKLGGVSVKLTGFHVENDAYVCELHGIVTVACAVPHTVSFCLQNNEELPSQTLIEAIDANSHAVYDTRILSDYRNVSVSYITRGRINYRFTRFLGDNMSLVAKPSLMHISIE